MRLKGGSIELAPIDNNFLPCSMSNWDLFISALNDEEVMRYAGKAKIENHTTNTQIEWINKINADKSKLLYGIIVKHEVENRLVGSIRLDIDRNVGLISLWLMKNIWGKGIGTEAIELISDFAFNHLGLNRVEAGILDGNMGSIKAFQKAGFKEEGRRRQRRFFEGKFVDEIMMSKLKED